MQKFIIPAVDGDPELIKKRDNILKQLLFAAHSAHNLREGVNY